MSVEAPQNRDLAEVETRELDELIRRVADIDHLYRTLAEKMGQLYLKADEAGLVAVTGLLDKPMRNASENHQAIVALEDEMTMRRHARAARV